MEERRQERKLRREAWADGCPERGRVLALKKSCVPILRKGSVQWV
jgi:hypothetical protein